MEFALTLWQAATAFPTVILSVLLGLAMLYWVFSMLTGADGVDGAVEGMAEGLAEGAIDGVAEGLADGALEGAAEGLAEGAEGFEFGSNLGRGLVRIGVTAVPFTLFITMLLFFSWITSLALTHLLGRHVGLGVSSALVGGAILAGALALGLFLTACAVRPLKPLFRGDRTLSRHDLVGRTATLTTSKVTDTFGMAEYHDGAAGLLVQVRCTEPNTLTRSDRVRISRYDASTDSYDVTPDNESGDSQAPSHTEV
jgi:hypothetical protein